MITEEELRKTFDLFDFDKSGSIDERELQQAIKSLGVICNDNMAKKVLRMVDSDCNGTVEWEEFHAFFGRVGDPEDIKDLLADSCHRFFEYKMAVETDPNFAKTFQVPEIQDVVKKFMGHNESIEKVAWLSADELMSASIDAEVLVWSASDTAARPVCKRKFKVGKGCALYSMAVDAPRRLLLAGLDGKGTSCMRLITPDDGEEKLAYEGHKTPVYCCAFSNDISLLASGEKKGEIFIHDASAAECVVKAQVHKSVVYAVDYQGASSTICTASKDGSVKVVDSRGMAPEGKADLTIDDAAASGAVWQARWRGQHDILSCGDDYCIKRWDIRNIDQGPVSSYFGHTSVVRSLELSPDGEFFASGVQTGGVRLWQTDRLNEVEASLELAVTEIGRSQKALDDLQERFEAGEGDLDELKAARKVLTEALKSKEELSGTHAMLRRQGYYQAVLGFDGGSMPVSTIAWFNGPDGVRLATGAHDQALRLYHVDMGALPSQKV